MRPQHRHLSALGIVVLLLCGTFQGGLEAAAPPTIVWQGVTKYPLAKIESEMSDSISAIQKEGLSLALADDLAFYVGLFYRNNGYYEVQVDYEITLANCVELKVHEGDLFVIGKVTIDGAESFPETNLQEYIVGPTREKFNAWKREFPYVETYIADGVDLLERYYLDQGRIDVTIDPPETTFESKGGITKVNLLVRVHEGLKYSFAPPQYFGNGPFSSVDLTKEIAKLIAEPWSANRTFAIEGKVLSYYKARGYFDAKVHAVSDPLGVNGTEIPLIIQIDPGPVYYFDEIVSSGEDRLRKSFVRRRFARLLGKKYSPDAIDEVFKRMMRTGLFTQVRVTPVKKGSDRLKLDIQIKEANTRDFGFSLGYGTYEGGIVGASWQDRNLFGFGRPFGVLAEYTQRGPRAEITLEDPWFLETELQAKLRLFVLNRNLDSYTKQEVGAYGEISKTIAKHLKLGGFVQGRKVQIEESNVSPAELGPSDYLVTSVGGTATYDRRDSVINPTKGWIVAGSAEYATKALGGDLDFLRALFRATAFVPLGPTVLALGVRTGFIETLDPGQQLPIDERFFIGGSTTIRGYNERQFGPENSDGYYLGGETFNILNAELTFPIYLDIKGAVFTDVANLLYNNEPFNYQDMQVSVGIGLRYGLPIGPIRLDYGYNVNRQPGDPVGEFHVSFGFAF